VLEAKLGSGFVEFSNPFVNLYVGNIVGPLFVKFQVISNEKTMLEVWGLLDMD
jgi:hypothetical protein